MKYSIQIIFSMLLLLLGGCSFGLPVIPTPTNTIIPNTPTPVQFPTQQPETKTPEATPTLAPRTLVICLGSQPGTLYPYSGDIYNIKVLDAIYDGPIDRRSFGYYPVILEKLPSLADGDMQIQTVMVREGDLVVDNNGELTTLSEGDVIRPAGCQTSDCAKSYAGGEVEMDQMMVLFTLLKNLKWADGKPLTAHDSVYSYELEADPDTPADKYLVRRSASYEVIDERTTRWIGLPGFLDQTYFLNFWTPYPEHIWGQYTASELLEKEALTEKPPGWGAYQIEEWKKDAFIRLSRNPNYFRANEGLPRFDQLIFRFVGGDPESNLSMLLSGKCDVLDEQISYNLIESATFTNLQAENKIKADFVPGTAWEHIDFSLQPPDTWQGFSATGAFQDIRLRQAITLCLDRQRVVDEVFLGQSFVPNGYLPPLQLPSNYQLPAYGFDVQAGSALLDEIGWVDDDNNPTTPRVYQGEDERIPSGAKLEFNYWTTISEERTKVTQILAESLAQCGITAHIQQWAAEALFNESSSGPLQSRSFDIVEFAFTTSEFPQCYLWLTENIPGDPTSTDSNGNPLYPQGWSGTNVTGFSNPEFDQSCRTALSLLPGQAGYEEAQLKAQEIFAGELPTIPLYMRIRLAVTRPDMCGFIMDATAYSEMWNIEEFDYGPGCPD